LGTVRIESGAHVEYPSDAELKAAAPIAYEASTLLRDRCDVNGHAARCTHHFLVDPAATPKVKVRITLSATTEMHPCTLTREYVVDARPTDDFAAL
jgi:hypothetical protein